MNMKSPVEECFELRTNAAGVVAEAFGAPGANPSELGVAQRIGSGIAALSDVLPAGWYDPPPGGVAVLFAGPQNNFGRTRFSSLRSEDNWPSAHSRRAAESVGIVHVSPVTKKGIIGDWGATMYTGSDEKIRQHVATCLATVEDLAEFAEVGMEFGEISRQADAVLKERRLTTDRTLLTNARDVTGTNCGHTIPFTDRQPPSEELAILRSGSSQAIAELISTHRIFINANETRKITDDMAFTAELRLESLEDPTLPNIYFHLIVGMHSGKKTILGGFNPFFETVGMDYLQSRY